MEPPQNIRVVGVLDPNNIASIMLAVRAAMALSHKRISFLIDSDGGYAKGVISAMEELEELKVSGLILEAHIVSARSAAVLFAIAANTRTIQYDGSIVLHLGSISVESAHLNPDDSIHQTLAESLRTVSTFYRETVQKTFNLSSKERAGFEASGMLKLSAQRLREMGFAQINEEQLILDLPESKKPEPQQTG